MAYNLAGMRVRDIHTARHYILVGGIERRGGAILAQATNLAGHGEIWLVVTDLMRADAWVNLTYAAVSLDRAQEIARNTRHFLGTQRLRILPAWDDTAIVPHMQMHYGRYQVWARF